MLQQGEPAEISCPLLSGGAVFVFLFAMPFFDGGPYHWFVAWLTLTAFLAAPAEGTVSIASNLASMLLKKLEH